MLNRKEIELVCRYAKTKKQAIKAYSIANRVSNEEMPLLIKEINKEWVNMKSESDKLNLRKKSLSELSYSIRNLILLAERTNRRLYLYANKTPEKKIPKEILEVVRSGVHLQRINLNRYDYPVHVLEISDDGILLQSDRGYMTIWDVNQAKKAQLRSY